MTFLACPLLGKLKVFIMRLQAALRFLSVIREVDSEMPLPQVHCLLLIAEADEGISLTELARKAGIGLATASRHVGFLGAINRFREEGHNLVEAFEDPMERRKKIIRLTDKGKALLVRAFGENYANLSKR